MSHTIYTAVIHIIDFLDIPFQISINCHLYIYSQMALKINNLIGNILDYMLREV